MKVRTHFLHVHFCGAKKLNLNDYANAFGVKALKSSIAFLGQGEVEQAKKHNTDMLLPYQVDVTMQHH